MKYLKGVTIYYWSANHIALSITQADSTYEEGKFFPSCDEEGNLVHTDNFQALTHDSDPNLACTSDYFPELLKDLVNDWWDNKKRKTPAIIKDFWEDCSNYIRQDQIELLQALYQIMITYRVFDDNEDLEDGYDDDQLPHNVDMFREAGVDVRTGSEKRAESLTKASLYELLQPLTKELQGDRTALEKKYLILQFIEQLKTQKGLGIDMEGENEDTMYGKLPIKEWVLPLGNSLTKDNGNDYRANLNLFGLNIQGIENGIKKFENPHSVIHHGMKEPYYKFFSRYHNCAGYSRFLLEQGGISAFCSTNELEKFGVTDPCLYSFYMVKVQARIEELNKKARDLMRSTSVFPKPLDSIIINYLAIFKKGEPIFNALPATARNIIDEYNKELIEVSYENKIKLLIHLVDVLHSHNTKQSEVIDALQKEIRRNYEIHFDAQFSHNHSFELECLGVLSVISTSALAVGILAIACPHLIPITLALAIVITVVSVATMSATLGIFTKKLQPQRPLVGPNLANIKNGDEPQAVLLQQEYREPLVSA